MPTRSLGPISVICLTRRSGGALRVPCERRAVGQYVRMNLRPAFLACAVVVVCAATPIHAFAPAPGPAGSASIFATVGHSEWCPPGTVRLDIGTGRFTVTAPRGWRTCRRPPYRSPVRTGVLPANALTDVRIAYHDAAGMGLDNPACRSGRRPAVVIGNGGFPTLRLTSGGRTRSPPRDLACWSEAARHLHRVLDNAFNPRIVHRR
jgi:hypothetical protein